MTNGFMHVGQMECVVFICSAIPAAYRARLASLRRYIQLLISGNEIGLFPYKLCFCSILFQEQLFLPGHKYQIQPKSFDFEDVISSVD